MKRPRLWIGAALVSAVLGCSNGDWSSGDRVLVSKVQYESRIKEPQRFDVVVFKFPDQPLKKNTPTNYIKRLMGLPGEIIAIFFGRLFRFPAPAAPALPLFQDLDQEVDAKSLRKPAHMHLDDPMSKKWFEEGRFEILRKAPDVMLATRRSVYDNNYPPRDAHADPRWAPASESGWTADKQHGFDHQGAKGQNGKGKQTKDDDIDWLRYQHLPWYKNRPLAGNREVQPELITDFMGYNAFDPNPNPAHENWVGDLMIECQVQASKGEGEFWLELSKGINRFQAKWDLGTGMCTLYKNEYRQSAEGESKILKLSQRVELDSKPTKLRGPGTYQVRFANFDARLTVWVDRELPFGDGKDYPPPEVRNSEDKDVDDILIQNRRGPTRNDLQPASIGSKGAAVQVHYLRLWRDTYYTLTAAGCDVRPNFNDPPINLADPQDWGDYRKMRFKTLYVQPGHYLCLGDNSQASSDGRDWGLVPERLMLGRALLVYYPFHRAGAIR